MNLRVYHHVFATRAQASAFVAQERQRYPASRYETDLTVAPRTERPSIPAAPTAPGGAHQWVVDGSRLDTPRGE